MAPDASSDPQAVPSLRIGFLGPEGTFTEEALLGEDDYAAAAITPSRDRRERCLKLTADS